MNLFICILVMSRSRKLAPENLTSLKTCVDSELCMFRKEGGFAHVGISPNISPTIHTYMHD